MSELGLQEQNSGKFRLARSLGTGGQEGGKTEALLAELIATGSRGIALVDPDGYICFRNRQFEQSLLDRIPEILQSSEAGGFPNIRYFPHEFGDIRVEVHRLSRGIGIVTDLRHQNLKVLAGALATLSTAESEEQVLRIAAMAAARTLGWRWAATARFGDQLTDAEVVGWWANDGLRDGYNFDLLGTPCEVVARTSELCMFLDVPNRFPNNESLKDMGAAVYAGIVYSVKGKPAGHLFAIHDSVDVDVESAEEVIRLIAACIENRLELTHAQSEVAVATKSALIDPLTDLPNRRAFDQDVSVCVRKFEDGELSESVLAIADLDGLKSINDHSGHQDGDRYIAAFAKVLARFGRPDDKAYRIGGDEFALLINTAGPKKIPHMRNRIRQLLSVLRKSGFPKANASVGFSTLKEADGDPETWIRLADKRMYEKKRTT